MSAISLRYAVSVLYSGPESGACGAGVGACFECTCLKVEGGGWGVDDGCWRVEGGGWREQGARCRGAGKGGWERVQLKREKITSVALRIPKQYHTDPLDDR
jgi:hypothetical protein